METIKTVGLCTSAMNFKEADKLISLCSMERGKITAKVKGVSKSNAKLKYCAEIMCFGTYFLNCKNGIYTVIGCDLIDNFYDIRLDIEAFYSANLVLEITEKLIDNLYPDKFVLGAVKALKDICYKSLPCEQAVLAYLLKAMEYAGYRIAFPIANADVDVMRYFDTHTLAITTSPSANYLKLPYDEYCLLKHYSVSGEIYECAVDKTKVVNAIFIALKYLYLTSGENIKCFEQYLKLLK